MGRLFAVGDIHGCVDPLHRLLQAISLSSGDRIVFLGDYVDRGPESRAVVDRLLELDSEPDIECIFLRGNHEDMLLDFLGEDGMHGDSFLANGGKETLWSYGSRPLGSPSEFREALPAEHLDFFRRLSLHHVEGRLLFVHAGVRPLRGLTEQVTEDLLWIRGEFVHNRHRLPYTVVFGHTPWRDVYWNLPFKIGLDTGCVYGNQLSCLEFTTGVLFQASAKKRAVTKRETGSSVTSLLIEPATDPSI